MRVELNLSEHCNVPNFVICAESTAEAIILRMFVKYGYNRRLFLYNSVYKGDSVYKGGDGCDSFCFGWLEEAQDET